MCSIHLDDVTAAIVRQNAHHTPAYWWRGDSVIKPISVWGWLGGHDGQRPIGKFGQDAGVTPLLFFEGHPGIFNDHRESGPRFNVSSEGRINFVLSDMLFFTVKVTVAANFHFINHQGPRFQLKFFIIFVIILHYSSFFHYLGGLRVDKWTANFHMWVTYLLKICPLNKNLRNQNGLSMTSLWKPFIEPFFFFTVYFIPSMVFWS